MNALKKLNMKIVLPIVLLVLLLAGGAVWAGNRIKNNCGPQKARTCLTDDVKKLQKGKSSTDANCAKDGKNANCAKDGKNANCAKDGKDANCAKDGNCAKGTNAGESKANSACGAGSSCKDCVTGPTTAVTTRP